MAPVRESAEIRDRSQRCFELFTEISRTTGDQESRAVNTVNDKFSRFRLWASNIGVFANDQLSLDFRVREAEEVKELFICQLDTIECRLVQLSEKFSGVRKDDTAVSGDEYDGHMKRSDPTNAQEWSLEELLVSIHRSLDWLQRLSNSIRKASAINQNKRAMDFKIENYGEGQLLETDVRDYYKTKVQEISPGLKDGWMIDRLTETMVLRLKRILYRRSRQIEWSFPQVELPSLEQLPLRPSPQQVQQPSLSTRLVDTDSLKAIPDNTKTTAPKNNQATTLNQSSFRRQRVYEKSEISRSTSASTNRRYPLNIPPPPNIAINSEYFTCPYCYLVLKSNITKEKGKAWRKHVTLDLEPYICIFSNCKSPFEIYPTKAEWLSHMKTSHRMRWQCLAVQAGHEPFISETAEEFEEHMMTTHAGDFKKDDLSFITNISHQAISPTIEYCPFCLNYATRSIDVEEHVIHHLQDFALLSIEVPTSLLSIQPGSQGSDMFFTGDDDELDSKACTRSTIRDSRSTWESPLTFDDNNRSGEEALGARLEIYDHFESIKEQHEELHASILLEPGYKSLAAFACKWYNVPSIEDLIHFVTDSDGVYDTNSASDKTTRPCRQDFQIAVICALRLEYDAVALAFDEFWDEDEHEVEIVVGDHSMYKIGRIGSHNVVLALLPHTGKASAASATAGLRLVYPKLKLAVLTGICSGVPSPGTNKEILLGDVIISKSIVQYEGGQFARNHTVENNLGRTNKITRFLLATFETHLGLNDLHRRTAQILAQIQQRAKSNGHRTLYNCPPATEDKLFEPVYLHRHRDQRMCSCNESDACLSARITSCEQLQCDVGRLVPRERLERKISQEKEGYTTLLQEPRIFFGHVGSGEAVMKSGEQRDRIAEEHSIIAFEMEGAGVSEEIPCIVIKAVCDYADSHMKKKWYAFAAATAASTMKAFLERYPQTDAPSAARTWFLVPYAENPDFVGRGDVLETVRQRLRRSQSQTTTPGSRVAVYGLGGIGKTQAALAYVYWLKDARPDVSVFWVHASNAQRFHQAFASIAKECNIPGCDEPKADLLMLTKKWLEDKERNQWLMVVDNADDTQLFFHAGHASDVLTGTTEAEGNLGRYIPVCAHGSILITTRDKQLGARLALGKPPIEISRMAYNEATQLLRLMLDDDTISTAETSLLSARLEHLPLALAQAASYIQENSMSINDYIRILDESNTGLVDCLSEPFEASGRDSETSHTLTATWVISFEQIERQHPLASEILSLISLFDCQAIPKDFVADYCRRRKSKMPEANQAVELVKAFGILKAFSFVSEVDNQCVDMHRLIQVVTRKWLVSRGRMSEFTMQALQTVSSAYPFGQHETRDLCLQYLPHANAVLENASADLEDGQVARASLLHNVAGYFFYRGQWKDAELSQAQAVNMRKKVLGDKHPDTLSSMANLASTYRNQGRWKESEELEVQVLGASSTVLGENHPNTLRSMTSLALTYQDQGRWKEAEELFMQVIDASSVILGEEHPDMLRTKTSLASTYQIQGRWKEAEELLLRVVETSSAVLGEDHPSTLSSMANLASTYSNQGRWKDAEELFVRVMETRKRVLGEDHPDTLSSMNNLANTWKSQGRSEDAVQLMQDCVLRQQKLLGSHHPDAESSLSTLMEWEEGSQAETS